MPSVGVVIPTLNEAHHLPALLKDIDKIDLPREVIVVDGGSHDDTPTLARKAGARVMTSRRGRAFQMNAGAQEIEASWLCFLHADIRIPRAARRDLANVVGDPAADAAVWRLAIDQPGWWYRTVEWGAWVRDRLAGLPYGDQGLLIRRTLFERLGGFPEYPVLEDVALVRTVRRHARLKRLSSSLVVSPRRWTSEGGYRTWVRNTAVVGAYFLGASPHRLARWYRPHRA